MSAFFPDTEVLQKALFDASLRHIATGGEHIVCVSADLPHSVLKISSNTLRWMIRRGEPVNAPSQDTLHAIAKDELETRSMRMTSLHRHFDSHHVLDERRYLVQVPLTNALLTAALAGRPSYANDLAVLTEKLSAQIVTTTWAVVTVQTYLSALDRPITNKTLSLVGGYSDDGTKADRLDAGIYARVTHMLVFSGRPLARFDRSDFLRVQTRPELAVLVDALERDDALCATLRSLLRRIHSYVKDTGEILDTAGPGNILLIGADNSWQYVLVDALSIHNEPVLHLTRNTVAKLASGSEITDRERLLLMKSLNFLRTVNGIGACVGLHSDITLSPEPLPFGSIDCLRETRRLVPK
jgi:hypothetical protein